MNNNVFFFMDSPHNLFEKIIFDRNKIDLNSSEKENYYYIMNLIFSLNHILDWVLNNETIQNLIKLECIKNFNPYDSIANNNKKIPREFKSYYKNFDVPPPINKKQKCIRELCNNTKHFKIEKFSTSTDIDYTSSNGMMQAGDVDAFAGNFQYKFIVYDFEEDNITDLLKLCDELILQWNVFLIKYNITAK